MKNALIIVSIIIFLKPIIPVIEYVVLYDYIVENLCINKDKPQLECNGKCHLMKELKRTTTDSEESQSDYNPSQFQFSLLFYEENEVETLNHLIFPTKKSLIFNIPNLYSFSLEKSVFHPPTCS